MNELTIPGRDGPVTFDTSSIDKADGRIHEIAFVNALKAPELLATFLQAHIRLTYIISRLEIEKRYAERTADERRSVIILDEAKDKLKEKGLSKDSNPAGSADLRQAILDGDNSLQNLLDRVAELEALSELYRSQQRALDNAIYSVKDILKSRDHTTKEETYGDAPNPENTFERSGHDIDPGFTKPSLRGSYRKPTL